VVEAGEAEMIHSVFELGDTVAREVMVPRTEIVWIERDKSVRQAVALCLRSGFSRIPVIAESVDDIVGVVHLKDLVARTRPEDPTGGTVGEVMRPATFVPDSKPLTGLLREMQVSRNHMAVVVDEYGGTAGLLTIEDILEEIVGEITDESDTDERPPIEHLADGKVRVISRLPVIDLGELFAVDLSDTDVETVGGLLAQQLGRVPVPGAEAGAAVRDTDGRTYIGVTVSLSSLTLTALQAAVATAVASGATGLEAAAVVSVSVDPASLAAVRELGPGAPVLLVDQRGEVHDVLRAAG
jgi:CBS domain containing-hemolysin-like protein